MTDPKGPVIIKHFEPPADVDRSHEEFTARCRERIIRYMGGGRLPPLEHGKECRCPTGTPGCPTNTESS